MCSQLYELHKLNQLQKLLSFEVLGYEQGVGTSPHQQQDTPMPEAYPPLLSGEQAAVRKYPAQLVAPMTGVCTSAQEEVDTNQDGAWVGQHLLPQVTADLNAELTLCVKCSGAGSASRPWLAFAGQHVHLVM